MALKRHEREVLYADIEVRRRGDQAPFPPISELTDLWREATAPAWKPKTFEKGTVTAIVADYDIDLLKDTVTLLVSIADPNGSDSTYADHVARASRTVAKTSSEGNEYSAHVVMSLKQRTGKPNMYACLIERVPTLSIGRLQAILNEVISKSCKANSGLFTFKEAGGQKTPKPYVPIIQIHLIGSDALEADVESGQINGLKLMKPAASSTGTAMGAYLIPQEYALRVRVSKKIPKGKVWDTIMDGLKGASAEFGKARLYLKPEGASSSGSVEIDTSSGALLSEAYARKRRIAPLNPGVQNGSKTIVRHLEAEMLKLLQAET